MLRSRGAAGAAIERSNARLTAACRDPIEPPTTCRCTSHACLPPDAGVDAKRAGLALARTAETNETDNDLFYFPET